MQQDIERWNQRYRNGDGVVDIEPEPEWLLPPCREILSANRSLPGLPGLDLACGKGGASLYLARLGYPMIALDGAIEGLKICQKKAQDLDLPVFPVVMDLDRIALPEAAFSFITVIRYLNRGLYADLIRSLAPGGTLFFKTFNHHHLNNKPTFNPAFVLEAGELPSAFSALDILASDESGTTSFLIARKPEGASN